MTNLKSFTMQINHLYLGDNLEVIKTFPDNSVDAVITDSPYGLGKEPDAVKCLQDWIDHGYHDVKGSGFMGKTWDAFVPQPILWKECFRVLKPGGHLLSFFGTRTYDWGTLAIRLAGFEIRDCVMWIYGSGFPKSLDISKAIDKAAGAEREVIGEKELWGHNAGSGAASFSKNEYEGQTGITRTENITAPATDAAKQWNGYGTALKPACEPICVARKPLEGTVIENVLKYGTGGINIDAGRVGTEEIKTQAKAKGESFTSVGNAQGFNGTPESTHTGRWPANIIHDGSDEVLAGFPYTKSGSRSIDNNLSVSTDENGHIKANVYGKYKQLPCETQGDSGSAARFFYSAKTSPAERAGRKHPTIKPLALMEYLVKVFCPAGGIVLDPFIGSGTTAVACNNTGHKWVGIEADPANYAEAKNFIYDGL